MRLSEACSATFARHETFHPRYGWTRKAVDAASEEDPIFNDEERAVVFLGVGKNMVHSIRFWGDAYKLLTQEKKNGSKQAAVLPTRMGIYLFGPEGVDPFAEDAGTAWLLHWRLLAPVSAVPVWWLAFNEFSGVEFTEEELLAFVDERTRDMATSSSSIKKDVSCFLRMYAGGSTARMGFDDQIDCPSRDLGLLSQGSERATYRFKIGVKPTLPPLILLYACLDFLARTDSTSKTVNMSRFSAEPGSPGNAFKLDGAELSSIIEAAAQSVNGVAVTSSAGVPQLVLNADPVSLGTKALQAYFEGQDLPFDSLNPLCGSESDAASTIHAGTMLDKAP